MELNETVWTILQILLVVLALGVTGFLLAMLFLYHSSVKQQWLSIDARAVPFGQSTYGRAAYNTYQNARGQVDQVTDPLIQRIMAFSVLRQQKLIKAEDLVKWLPWLLDLGGELLDGEVDTNLPPMPLPPRTPPSATG